LSGFGTSHLFKSVDRGASWNDIGSDLPDIPTSAVIVDPEIPDHVFVGNDLGVYFSMNAGSTWAMVPGGLPEAVIVKDLSISTVNRKLRAATHGNGVYEIELPELNTVKIHRIEIPISANITFDGVSISSGDSIGVYYSVADSLVCAGESVWDGTSIIDLTTHSDDILTPGKDGFSLSEYFIWKVFSMSENKTYEAGAEYDMSYPNDSIFVAFGSSRLTAINAAPIELSPTTGNDSICPLTTTSAPANPAGGSGIFFYSWSSNPSGFNSNLANPVVSPLVNTTYILQLNNYSDTIIDSILINVEPLLEEELLLQNESITGIHFYEAINVRIGNSVTVPPFGPFIIEAGADVVVRGGDSIFLEPGFSAKPGSKLHAYINPDYCSDQALFGQENNQTGDIDIFEDDSAGYNLTITSDDILLYPNPTNGVLYIRFNIDPEESYYIEVYDIMGNGIHKGYSRNKLYQFDLSLSSKSIYFIHIYYKGERYIKKCIRL